MTEKPRIIYTQSSGSFWVIPGVLYRGETGAYQLFDQMTPVMTQDKLAEVYETEKQKGNPFPTDMSLLWAISTRAYELRDQSPAEAEQLKVFLKKGFRSYPNTLTRVIYNSSAKDKVIHNYNTSDQYSLEENVVGPDDWITNIADKKVLDSILGTNEINKINQVSQWINRTNSYLWRLNSKPQKKDERVAGFGAGSGRLGFFCNGGPLCGWPAFRVLRVD